MAGFGGTKLEINAIDRSMSDLSKPNHDENDVMSARPQCHASNAPKTDGTLHDASKGDDRQVLWVFEVAQAKIEASSTAAVDLRLRSRARRSRRPLASRFESWPTTRPFSS
jgi:hypothetical protein